jgi:hypothetical protein
VVDIKLLKIGSDEFPTEAPQKPFLRALNKLGVVRVITFVE